MSIAEVYRPGTVVTVTDQPGPISAPTATDAWFVTGPTTFGPVGVAGLVRSIRELEALYGPRDPSSLVYDGVETFLREGGSRAFISRVAAADAELATVTLQASGGTDVMAIDANSVGVWGNEVSVQVAPASPSGFNLVVSYQGVVVQTSPALADAAAAAQWAATSTWISVTPIGAGVPASGSFPLAGGDDGAVTETEWTNALDAFLVTLGPGQVSPLGRTTPEAHLAARLHCSTHNRTAFLDSQDTGSADDLINAAASDTTGGEEDRFGGLWGSWAVIPGLAAGTEREVPWSCVQAGIVARNDGAGVSPAQPGAGQQFGRARTVLRLTHTFSAPDRDRLTNAGINVARDDLGLVEGYGFRTQVDAVQVPQWRELGQVRLIMAIVAQADAIAEAHLFAILDGRRHEIVKFGGELTAMLIPFYEDGSLYGNTPQEAFRVDVGPAVNTEATIAAGELHAVIALRCSHMAELVFVEIVKVETTQALAA